MKRFFVISVLAIAIAIIAVVSCSHPKSVNAADTSNYPPEIAAIIINNCAISGCHDAASYTNSDGLLLDTWEHLFQGAYDGSSVIPYSTQYSPFLYFVNTDSLQGPVAQPTMPISTPGRNLPPLTKAQYLTLQNWIAAGAPDKNGNVAFSTDPDTRQKIYITQQGCDQVAVVDAESKQTMRYIPVGVPLGTILPSQSPHDVTISDDGMYGYVALINGAYVQKIDTRYDSVINQDDLGATSIGWSIVDVAPGDTAVVVSDFVNAGSVACINPQSMTTKWDLQGLTWPHGIENNATFDTFFVCSEYGNVIYKFTMDCFPPYSKEVTLDGGAPYFSTTSTSPDPHQIQMSPDHSKYFVTCQNSNEVRVMDAHADTLIAVIPVGKMPQEMDISSTYPYLFAVCLNDGNNPIAGDIGSVYVINYNTYQVVTILYGDFYQPHDITVDDLYGQLFIISENQGGTAHHVSACGGAIGWYSVYDLESLQPSDNIRYYLTRVPYASAARF